MPTVSKSKASATKRTATPSPENASRKAPPLTKERAEVRAAVAEAIAEDRVRERSVDAMIDRVAGDREAVRALIEALSTCPMSPDGFVTEALSNLASEVDVLSTCNPAHAVDGAHAQALFILSNRILAVLAVHQVLTASPVRT